MLKITIATNNGMIANSMAEYDEAQFMYSQGDWHQIELVILHQVDTATIPGILRQLADDLQRSQQQNESFQEWQQSASATMQSESESESLN